MGSLKSGLFAIALASLVGTAAVVGCSADGGSAITEADPTDPVPNEGTGKLPPTSGTGDNTIPDAGKDASKKDSGPKQEAGVDAGPPAPVEGAACPKIGDIGKKTCGACGYAETLCIDNGSGKGKWDVYGVCGHELAGGCTPGTTADCGNCGKKTCTNTCVFPSVCSGEPVGACKAGAKEYSSASCPTAGTYRNRTCGATCAWSPLSGVCETPVNDYVLNIGSTVTAVTSKTIAFTQAKQASRLIGTCASSSLSATATYPYQYVELHNPTAKAAKVTVYASTAPGGVVIDTVMAVYAIAIQPMDDASRKACRDGVNDQSPDTTLTGSTNFSLLSGVAIPAGGSVLVYLGSWYEFGDTDFDGTPYVTTGDLNINTKIEQLN